jgi:hypothetical protein
LCKKSGQSSNERIQFRYAVNNQNITIYTQNNQKEISADGMSKTPTCVLIALPELPVFGSLEIPLF